MKHGFFKIGAAIPHLHLAAPRKNAEEIIRLIGAAREEGVRVLAFPELSVTGATAGDLYFSDALIEGAQKAVLSICRATKGTDMLVFFGAPLRRGGRLYNCVIAASDGCPLGVTAANIPAAGERAEGRHFSPVPEDDSTELGGELIPFGKAVAYPCLESADLTVGCAVGDDGDTLRFLAKCGATLLVNPAASAEIVGREDARRTWAKALSAETSAALLIAGAGDGESTTDLVFSGHSLIAERGRMRAENEPFGGAELITAVIDAKHLAHEQMKTRAARMTCLTATPFSLGEGEVDLKGVIDKSPFVPADPEKREAVCARIFEIQARGLARRVEAARADTCLIGLSGGLDSTLALLVASRAMELLGRDPAHIIAVTMPCFGTTSRTRSNAQRLGAAFGTSFRTVDIKEAVDVHFRDIGHDPEDHSVVYENAQARERTQILMDIANAENGLVVGTGDLSELALGWATYNGDQMSNYGVNGGVPKTLVRELVSYYAETRGDKPIADTDGADRTLGDVLRDVLDTPVSPELLPPENGVISQKTESLVGPYELHDFFLYHTVRWGETPDKILREAKAAFAGDFDPEVIERWLGVFLRRFRTQQFKRSALPDGPKVGTVGLSPRGGWMMPSDAGTDL